MDWNLYFEGEELSAAEIEGIIKRLKSASLNRT